MTRQDSGLDRRKFLRMVGMAGGAAAVHETMVALGLMNGTAWAGPRKWPRDAGKGRSVVILGAGVGGLATAYELSRAGFACTVLEAQHRVGGRSFTARRGDVITEIDGRGRTVTQECRFDDDPGLYVNLGPGRIPYHHRRALHLCRELGVPLEVYVHTSDNNVHRMEGGPAVERRRIAYDTQGYIAELLAKAINQSALDRELGQEDQDKLLSLLQKFGDLDHRYRYVGSTRAGCRYQPLDVTRYCDDNAADAIERLRLDQLLTSEFWDPCLVGAPRGDQACDPTGYGHGFYQVTEILWQTTSFQPVGGMDQLVKGFEAKLGGIIRTGAAVTRIGLSGGGDQVEVRYRHGSREQSLLADLCVSNIPLPVLKDIDTPDFAPHFQAAIDHRVFSNSCKVGWQAERRFWELDDHIYGGISWLQHPITQVWYPSNDYHARKGVLTGAYNYDRTAREFGELAVKQRLDLAYQGGALLHPRAFHPSSTDVPKDRGVTIAWQNVPFQNGCYAIWDSDSSQDELDYESLLVPDLGERFYVVGDQVSTLPGWQAGALMSAEHVCEQVITGHALDLEKVRREIKRAPMSLSVMG